MADPYTTYTIVTGIGIVTAEFPPDSSGIVMDGSADAVRFVRSEIARAVDIDGIPLSPERIEPFELMEMAEANDSAITVLPPLDLDDAP